VWLPLLCLVVMTPAAAWAQRDTRGSADHPMIPRLPGYDIEGYDAQDFGAYEFPLKDGVAADRLTTAGFADDTPVADNTSEAGRAKNWRVELVRR
jgi:hypothetical protein